MGLIINHNMMAMTAARNLSVTYNRLATSTQRLSSGLRINSAADDAAGLAVRELMRADIAVLNQGVRNAGDGISLIQTAEGALSVIDEKLIRMKELAEQASTGTYTTAQRLIMDSEYQAMANEIDRIANATDFNGVKLLDGSITSIHSQGIKIHFGTGNDSAEDYYYINIGDMRATSTTGLQVGGGATAEVTTATYGISANDTLSGGYFAFQYNADGDSAGIVAGDIAGFYQIQSGQTISDMVTQINQGTAARLIATTGAVSNSMTWSIVVGGTHIIFTSADSVAYAANRVIISRTDLTASALASAILSAINNAAGANIWAVEGSVSTDIIFLARNPGVGGNNLSAFENTSAISFTSLSANVQGTLNGGGTTWATASITTTNSLRYLTLTGADSGNNYSISVVDVSASSIGQTDVANGAMDDDSAEWNDTTAASGSGGWNGADILTQSAAQAALAQIDAAINAKDTGRANLGAYQNRLENTITNLTIQAESLQGAESRISDVDVAIEMTEFTRNNILVQSATAMLAQANTLPQMALQLIGA